MDKLPSKLKLLCITGESFNQPVDKLPDTLNKIRINSRVFDQSVNNLPDTLEKFFLWSVKFNQPVSKLPKTLETLKIKSSLFNQNLDNLPKTLKKLQLWMCSSFDKELDYNLLNNIDTVEIIGNGINYKHGKIQMYYPEFKKVLVPKRY